MRLKSSFTLIELLIVIGILAILVVTILITLSPSEAQKKARDAKRMKDLVTLQAIAIQYINDGGAPFCTQGHPGTHCESYSAGTNIQSQPCNNSWLTYDDGSPVDLCKYTSTIPVDPSNNTIRTYINGGTVQSPAMSTNYVGYILKMSGSDYKIGVRQESKSNANNVLNDGGNCQDWAEVFSNDVGKALWGPC